MNSQKKILILGVGLALMAGFVGAALANDLPTEPAEQFLVDEDVNIINGLYTREYSLAGNGVVDYKTARQIILSEYNEYWNSVVETKEFPLFYWYDADQDGKFEMWGGSAGERVPMRHPSLQRSNRGSVRLSTYPLMQMVIESGGQDV